MARSCRGCRQRKCAYIGTDNNCNLERRKSMQMSKKERKKFITSNNEKKKLVASNA